MTMLMHNAHIALLSNVTYLLIDEDNGASGFGGEANRKSELIDEDNGASGFGGGANRKFELIDDNNGLHVHFCTVCVKLSFLSHVCYNVTIRDDLACGRTLAQRRAERRVEKESM
jgi:hypothetical protein